MVAHVVPKSRSFLMEEVELRFRRYRNQQPSRKEDAYPVHARTIGAPAAVV